MDRKHFLLVTGITLVALALAILLPGGRKVEENPRLPWRIDIDDAGRPKVLGLTIGESTLQQARQLLQQQGTVNLFASSQQIYAVEAYFQRVHLSGIRADMVLTLALDQSRMAGMFDRGLRISQMESGGKKIKLAEEDMVVVGQARISHLTYIPATDLDQGLILSRFGEPGQRIGEPGGVIHWLYPEKGLDIAVNPDGKEVFQYLPPANFDQVLEPLQSRGRLPQSGIAITPN